MIQIKNLSVAYGNTAVIRGLTTEIGKGEWVLLTGPSGCGKSTLGRVICGLIPHSIPARVEGSVLADGIDPGKTPIHITSQHIAMVFQNPSSQLFHLKVKDEVKFGLRNLQYPHAEIEKRTQWALETTGIENLAEEMPANLSGGQKQCVALAAVLAMKPNILVLDEPTASLDDRSIQRVMSTLKDLKENLGITILMIEHRLTSAMEHADRILVMEDGEILSDSTPARVYTNNTLVQRLGLRKMTETQFSPWEKLIRSNGSTPHPDRPLLRLEHVYAGYNGTTVLKNISMEIYPGDFSALVGPNGSGKSTTALVASGLLKPKQGKVLYQNGKRPSPGQDVCLLFQNPVDQLFTECVDEEVAFGPQNFDCFNPDLHQKILEEADLNTFRSQPPLLLSVGQQHRTALAACAAMQPRLIILDEPTLGQDWGHLQRLMNLLKQLNAQGTAILLITHDYKLVYRYAKTVTLIENGEIKMKGQLSQKNNSSRNKEIKR